MRNEKIIEQRDAESDFQEISRTIKRKELAINAIDLTHPEKAWSKLEAEELFSLFTADIIKKKVQFTR